MTAIIVALVLFIIFCIPLTQWRRHIRQVGDAFFPLGIIALLHIVGIVPYLVLIGLYPDMISAVLIGHPSIPDFDATLIWYGIVQAVGFFALIAGYHSRLGGYIGNRLPLIAGRESESNCWVAVVLAVTGGLVGWVLLLQQIGGYAFLITHLHQRTSLIAGSGYLLYSLNLFLIGIVALIYSMRYRRTLGKILLTVLLGVGIIIIFSSLGGRGPAIRMFIISLLAWHYGVRRFTSVPWRWITLSAIFVIPYFVLIPILRGSSGAVERFMHEPEALITESLAYIPKAVKQTSYVEHYLLIVSHFSADRVWFGRSYRDLLYAAIPSKLIPNKPPVDDGVYVQTIAITGQDVKPNTPFAELSPSSWPPETLGISYMNFWVPGVLIGMFLLGAGYRLAYQYMQRSQYSLYSITIYGSVLLYFHLSNLRLMSTAMNVGLATLFYVVVFGGINSWQSRRSRQKGTPVGRRRTSLPALRPLGDRR
jgi:hypothetical protein